MLVFNQLWILSTRSCFKSKVGRQQYFFLSRMTLSQAPFQDVFFLSQGLSFFFVVVKSFSTWYFLDHLNCCEKQWFIQASSLFYTYFFRRMSREENVDQFCMITGIFIAWNLFNFTEYWRCTCLSFRFFTLKIWSLGT